MSDPLVQMLDDHPELVPFLEDLLGFGNVRELAECAGIQTARVLILHILLYGDEVTPRGDLREFAQQMGWELEDVTPMGTDLVWPLQYD